MPKKYISIQEYIDDFPKEVALILEEIRQLIKDIDKSLEEVISYNIPAFKKKKVVVYFAAYEKHIGFYALPSGNETFKKELSNYKTGKGSIQFPLNQPIPFHLIRQIVLFRLDEINNSKKK